MAWTRRNKFGVSPKEERTVDGIVFDSKKEAKRYVALRDMQTLGIITDLKMQVPFEWQSTHESIGGSGDTLITKHKYVADFTYFENGEWVVEDVKGTRTAEYKRKKRIVEHVFGINIKET